MKRLLLLVILLMTSGLVWSGAAAASGTEEIPFIPTANGEYGVYVFGGKPAEVTLLADGEEVASGEGALRVVTGRLTAGTEYTVRVPEGTDVEIARETLSRSFGMALELADGDGYSKLIARAGDIHWYKITAALDGAAILSCAPGEGLIPEARLYDRNGVMITRSEALPSGTVVMSAAFSAGEDYYVRVSAKDGGTGKYTLSALRSAVEGVPEAVRMSEGDISIEGRGRRALLAETLPAGVCPLVLMDSSDKSVADVAGDGTVRGGATGEAIITAYAYGGARTQCSVTVEYVPVESVALTPESAAMEVGDELTASVLVFPENANRRGVTFVTENPNVVTVDASGVLKAVGEGTAKIAAVSEDGGLSDVMTVTVTPAGRRYRALLIGQQNYASTAEQVRPGSINSVRSIEKLLGTVSFDGEGYEVSTLMDAPRDAVIAGIREAFAKAGEEDVSLVYITCHGFYSAGMSFFLMADGSVLSALDLERELREIPGEVILLADCCGSGGLIGEYGDTEDFSDGITGVFHGTAGGAGVRGSKVSVITSALLDQDSYRISFSDSSEEGMATVFARALCDAAGWSIDRGQRSSMNADADYDGEITIEELRVYMRRRVMWYLGLAGDYVQTVKAYPEGKSTAVFARP